MNARTLIPLCFCLLACTPSPTGNDNVPDRPTLTGLLGQLDAGAITSATIVAQLLERAERNDNLHALISINPEALNLAREADRQRAAGQVVGPLHGLPLVVKDNIHVAGLTNTAGTPSLRNFVPTRSNATVNALQSAGAIILAKANLHELAFGITSDNATFGAVANPADRQRFAGGSSGGTAAAIAAGLAPAGLGTDTGGSVRIPAALTGVAGFRPTTGRYPSDAVTPISHTRDTVGTLAASVADLVLLDQVITGWSQPVTEVRPDEIRLGLVRDYFFTNLEADTEQVVETALDRLRVAGVTLVDVEYPDLAQQMSAGFPLTLFEARGDLIRYLADYNTGVTLPELAAAVASPDVNAIIAILTDESNMMSAAAYQDALAELSVLRAGFKRLFTQHRLDALVFPTTPLTARPIANSRETVELNGQQVPTFPTYIRNTEPASLAGLPSLSLPAGVAANGLPVGLEIDGPADSDRRLLAIALVLEGLLGQAN